MLTNLLIGGGALLLATVLFASTARAEPNDDDAAARWLAAAPPVPEFKAPASRQEWEARRVEIREQLWQSLGKLPPRRRKLEVKTLSREDRGDYVLEKFQFDNGAGATVPGYLLLPKGEGKHPAVLYCHWHGGQYEVGKEELFRTNATPVPAGPAAGDGGGGGGSVGGCGVRGRAGRRPG